MKHMVLAHSVQVENVVHDHLYTNAYLLDHGLRLKVRADASNLNRKLRLHRGLHLVQVHSRQEQDEYLPER